MKLRTCIIISLLNPCLAHRWKLFGCCVFGAVKQYDKNSYMFLGPPFIYNTDVQIYCDNSNYEVKNGKYINKVYGGAVSDDDWKEIDRCYNVNTKAGSTEFLVIAITTSSDMMNWKEWNLVLNAWSAAGSKGSRPNPAPYMAERRNTPNTMDLCTWYLKDQKDSGFTKVDKSTIEKVQRPEFLSGLKGDTRPIDQLSQTLGGTFLHELTHTNLGGKLEDNKAEEGCYGWICVGALHDVNNADSINILGVALSIWKMGFYVDNDGTIKNL